MQQGNLVMKTVDFKLKNVAEVKVKLHTDINGGIKNDNTISFFQRDSGQGYCRL